MSAFFEWVIAKEYHDGPMSGIGLRSHDRKIVFFAVVGWDAEQWQRVFAVAPINEHIAHQLCSMLEKLEQRRLPFWLPGPATNLSEVSTIWQAALTEALSIGRWVLVESHDLLDVVNEEVLSKAQSAAVSSLVENNAIRDIHSNDLLQSFIEGMEIAD